MEKYSLYALLLCNLLIGCVYAQLPDNINATEIEDQLHKLAPGFEGFNSSALPSNEEVENAIKEKCERNGGGEEAFLALKNQQTELQSCMEQQLNYTQLQLEIEEAKKTGSMDEVFGKYCKKYPEIHQCMLGVTERVKPCLDKAEQETMDKILKVTEELKEFVCFKDGDRIAMFIAEGGVECLESKKEGLQVCANKTLGARIPTNISVNSLPMFLIDDRACQDFDEIRTCFNMELEQCKDSTPANIVDAFFKFLKKHIPCMTNVVKESSSLDAAVKESDSGASHSIVASCLIVAAMTVAKIIF